MRTLLLMLLLAAFQTLPAQKKYHTGVRIGMGQSQFTDVQRPREVPYFTAGGVATYQLTKLFDLNAEALLAYQGSEYYGVQERDATLGFTTDQPYDGTTRILSLKVPVYPGFSLGSDDLRFRIHAGPSLNFNLFGWEDRDFESELLNDQENQKLQRIDPLTFAVVYGAGLRIRTSEEKWVFLDFRYVTGTSNIHTFEFHVMPTSPKIDYFSVTAGYLF